MTIIEKLKNKNEEVILLLNMIVVMLTGVVMYRQFYILKILKYNTYQDNFIVTIDITKNSTINPFKIEKELQILEYLSYSLFAISLILIVISLIIYIKNRKGVENG